MPWPQDEHTVRREFLDTLKMRVGATIAFQVSQADVYRPILHAQDINPRRDTNRNRELGLTITHPEANRHVVAPTQLWLAPIRQRIESCVQTLKDILTLERHGARTLAGLRARIGARILTLAAGVWLNHQLGRPSRSLVAYVA